MKLRRSWSLESKYRFRSAGESGLSRVTTVINLHVKPRGSHLSFALPASPSTLPCFACTTQSVGISVSRHILLGLMRPSEMLYARLARPDKDMRLRKCLYDDIISLRVMPQSPLFERRMSMTISSVWNGVPLIRVWYSVS